MFTTHSAAMPTNNFEILGSPYAEVIISVGSQQTPHERFDQPMARYCAVDFPDRPRLEK
jgi:hypothetical protein